MNPKVGDPSPGVLSPKGARPAREHEELSVLVFVRMGVGLSLIVASVLVVVGLKRRDADTIASALGVLLLFSVAIWGGIGLIAIPALLTQMVRRTWAHRRSLRRGKNPGVWDDWIDGPGSS